MTTTTTINNTEAATPTPAEWTLVNPDIDPLTGWQALSDDIGGKHSFLIEYYKRCRSGEIIIGRELKTTLEMLIQDIFCGGGKYRFTLDAAHRRIDFIEHEIKHFQAPFAGKPFIMALCQKAFTEAIFGFYVYDTELSYGEGWVRRFQEVLFLVARKNGKTPLVGALVLAEWFCGKMGQAVMCASNDYAQAALVFNAINAFREESRTISHVTRKNNKGIFFGNPKQRKKTGKFSKQNKGSIELMSAKQGAKEGRNLTLVIADEIHEMKDNSTVLPLITSVSTQDEPLYFEITTEGIVRDGYLDARLSDARKSLKGEAETDTSRWLIWLYTQDSEAEIWNDERSWTKSNPMYGIAKKPSYLRKKVDTARHSGADRAFILAKDFNIKQLASNAWLEEKYIDCPATFDIADFAGSWCIIGVDLAETNDLCACTFLFMRPNDPVKYLHTMYFVTAVKAGDGQSTDSPTNPEKKNYIEWADAGLVRIVQDNVIDDTVVSDYIWDVFQKHRIRPLTVGYDEWHAKDFAKQIAAKFGKEVPRKIRMTTDALNVPTRNVETDLRARLINYNNNDICRWNFRNTAVRVDKNGFVMPCKINGYIGNKIDGTMSKVIAYAAAREVKSAFMAKIGG